MNSYKSQEGQDKWVVTMLQGKKKGYFVDIGASNGIKHSNTYILEKNYNWKGICVEPHTISFIELMQNRNCIHENLCIFDAHTKVDFVQRGRMKTHSGIYCDQADDKLIHQVINRNHPLIKKQAITLLELLDKHKSPQLIDYLSIDVEGSQWLILKNFNFDQYRFLLITVEHNCPQNPTSIKYLKRRENIYNYLIQHGYYLNRSTKHEDWFADQTII